ncbi:MAG: 50S ribosomal protein L35 [Candidatus Falkowbacteria bacterium]|jgi:ribosomal protein L35|nr:MAG: 50S ribosomal protein L35 [Candidatus Falkowbacteria bacterium]
MPKIKTHKATVKRFKKTGSDKLIQRKAGQDHFNSRETGNVGRQKRLDISTTKTLTRTIKALTPYN